MAPTRYISRRSAESFNKRESFISHGIDIFKGLIESAIPIREEDRHLIKDIAGDFSTHFKPDTFYSVEPYEFEIEKLPTRLADHYLQQGRIIRPSEPKADPKEKELKALSWECTLNESLIAETPFGPYHIFDYDSIFTGNKKWMWQFCGEMALECKSIDEAKSLCQSDFQRRVNELKYL